MKQGWHAAVTKYVLVIFFPQLLHPPTPSHIFIFSDWLLINTYYPILLPSTPYFQSYTALYPLCLSVRLSVYALDTIVLVTESYQSICRLYFCMGSIYFDRCLLSVISYSFMGKSQDLVVLYSKNFRIISVNYIFMFANTFLTKMCKINKLQQAVSFRSSYCKYTKQGKYTMV